MKKQFQVSDILEFTPGTEVSEIFLLSSASQGQAKNGPFWRLEFKDASGNIQGKLWSPQSQAYPELSPGCLVLVHGRLSSFRDKLELHVESLGILSEEETASLDLSLFVPASKYRPADMFEELLALCRKTFTHKPWRKFVMGILGDEEISAGLLRAPAAKSMHHAFAGGLLEHTLSIAKLSMSIADHYPDLDRQTLLAGAICHDLGKIWELSYGMTTEYTTQGLLIGHISIIMEKLLPYLKKSGLEQPLAEHLQHLILSHHGLLEYGSPKLPSTAEAMVLHYADNIDAKLQQFAANLAHIAPGESGWSSYLPALERAVFKPWRTPFSEAPSKKKNSKQDDLSDMHLQLPGVE